MEKFIKIIEKKDKRISEHFEKIEIRKLDKMYEELNSEHTDIRENLKDVNYLLDLIESHNIKSEDSFPKENISRKEWLGKSKISIEPLHLKQENELSEDEILFLKKEKSKLLFEKDKLEKEHHLIHKLMAKAAVYIINAQNVVCEEITKGHDIASVGEILLEHFGKEIKGSVDYGFGRDKIRRMLEKRFSINKIQSRKLIDILEKRKVIKYYIDYSEIYQIPSSDDFSQFTSTNYTPLFGTWHIDA